MEIKEKAYGVCLYKKDLNTTKILLCKSVNSKNKWGFLKGVKEPYELNARTAIREFYEESSIELQYYQLEKYFEQQNEEKDIGIFLVNYDNIKHIDTFFINDNLIESCICLENSEVKFFDIEELPPIKKKQIKIVYDIVTHLKR